MSSANQDPDKFDTLQNMWSPNRGKLSIAPGVAEAAIGMPGVDSILNLVPLQQTWGDKGWVIFYKPNYSTVTAPSGQTFTTLGTVTTVRSVALQYIVPGNNNVASDKSCFSAAAATFGTLGLRITAPTNIPTHIHCIQIWASDVASAYYVWVGTMYRKNGVFAASIDVREPDTIASIGPGVPPIVFEDIPTGFTFTPLTGGDLVPNRQYFFATAPVKPRDPSGAPSFQFNVASLCDTSTRFFAYTLPPGYSAISVKINLTGSIHDSGVAPSVTTYAYTQTCLFMGETPEDLLPISSGVGGTVITTLVSEISGTGTRVDTLPYNSNLCVNMADVRSGFSGDIRSSAGAGRKYGTSMYQIDTAHVVPGNATGMADVVGAMLIQAPYAAASHRELLGQAFGNFSIDTVFADGIPTIDAQSTGTGTLGIKQTTPYSSVPYLNRVYFADGVNTMYYTNGIILCPTIRDKTTKYIPITTKVQVLKDRFCLGGGPNNFSNTRGAVYFSDVVGSSTTGGIYSFGTTDWNYITSQFGDGSDIVGLGIYSRDLSNTGPGSFLVVGKVDSSFSWNGGTAAGDTQLVEIGKYNGWTSADCFCLTKAGAIFVSRNNVYLINGSDILPIGDDVQEIILGISEANLQYTKAMFIRDRLIIGYRETANVDRELWCDFRHAPDGSVEYVWTGPHVLKSYDQAVTVPSYNSIRDYRMSYLGAKLYRRDTYGTYTNDTASIAISLRTHWLALAADSLSKVLTQFFMRCKINKQETVTLTFEFINSTFAGQGIGDTGSGMANASDTMTLTYSGSGEVYREFQKIFATRRLGSLVRIAVALSTNVNFEIDLLSLLFNTSKRRVL